MLEDETIACMGPTMDGQDSIRVIDIVYPGLSFRCAITNLTCRAPLKKGNYLASAHDSENSLQLSF